MFLDEQTYPVETYNAPRQVATAVNSMWKGTTLMTPIGGGVQIRASEAIESSNLLDDEEGTVAATRASIGLDQLAEDQWWWD